MTPRTVARPARLSMGILQVRILEWVARPSSPGDLPNPGIEPRSPTLQADSLPSEPPAPSLIILGYTVWPHCAYSLCILIFLLPHIPKTEVVLQDFSLINISCRLLIFYSHVLKNLSRVNGLRNSYRMKRL